MKEVTHEFDIEPYESRLLDTYFHGKKLAVYDIETTGLFPRNDIIMLTGILEFDPDGNGDGSGKRQKAVAKQFFAEALTDEKEIIEKTVAELNKADYILTYNGKSFDVPFTVKRARKYGIDARLPFDLDLYLVVSSYSDIKKFSGSLSQKAIEEHMGIASTRDDRIDGYESIKLYHRYLETPSYALEKTILLHNHDDICQLYKILPVIRETDFDRAMFHLGFPAGDYEVQDLKITNSGLFVKAVKKKDPIDYISFPTEDAPYSVRMQSSDGDTEIDIPAEVIEKKAVVIDAETIFRGLYPEGSSELSDILCKMKRYPSFENGYLIIKMDGNCNFLETNLFVMDLLRSLRV